MYATARLWDDGIVFPQHTRQVGKQSVMDEQRQALLSHGLEGIALESDCSTSSL